MTDEQRMIRSVFDDGIPQSLEDLAVAINEEHRACEGAMQSTLAHAARAGKMLIYAKTDVPHGEWGDWLKENFEGSERTAQGYMRVYREWDSLEKTKRVADLSLRGALKELSEPKPESPPWKFANAEPMPWKYAEDAAQPPGGEGTTAPEEEREERSPWTPEERDLQRRLKAGETVVANKHRHKKLIEWTKENDLGVSITRPGKWGNHHWLPPEASDEERARAVSAYEHEQLPRQPERLDEIPTLKGKALICVCAPKLCHGHVLQAKAEGWESPTKPPPQREPVVRDVLTPQDMADLPAGEFDHLENWASETSKLIGPIRRLAPEEVAEVCWRLYPEKIDRHVDWAKQIANWYTSYAEALEAQSKQGLRVVE
jgi:Domain of unknown function (DUF4326)/Protein of unknown function (DUF3102)